MANKSKLARIDVQFEVNARKLYPFAKSLLAITQEFNKEIEKQLYGVNLNDKKQKGKHT